MLLAHDSTISSTFPIRSVYRSSPRYGSALHWLEAGWENTETVVLLHGLMAHSMAYRRVAHSLAASYRTIIPDLPAHGRDQTFRSQDMSASVAALIDWLEELLNVLNLPAVHLVGHSLGALVSFLAAQDSARFSGLRSVTLVSPGLQISAPRWMPHLLQRIPVNLARVGASRIGMRLYEPIQWRRARMSTSELKAYLQPIREFERLEYMLNLGADLMKEPDRLVGADKLRLPSLVVWGQNDHLLPVSTAYLLQSQIPDTQLAIFDNCGHCPMEDCPADFIRVVNEFFVRQTHTIPSLAS